MKMTKLHNSHSNERPAETPLPMWQVISVFMVQLAEAMNVNVLFPFLAFMIEDMGHGGHELGYYAGGLAAAFCGAQFSSSVAWGMISDNYGRKPAVFLGTLGTAIGMLIFGTAKTYWQAVLGRIIGGVLCGNLGVVKSFLSEITDETNQGKGFSYLSIAWSLGSLLAPLAGGLLCSPADKYPQFFSKDGIFGYYPYLLPCLICVINNVVTAFFCLAVMRETRKFKKSASSNTLSTSSTVALSPKGHPTKNPLQERKSFSWEQGDIELTQTRGERRSSDANAGTSSSLGSISFEDDEKLTKQRGLSRSAEEAAKFSIIGQDDDDDDELDEEEKDSGNFNVVKVPHLEVEGTSTHSSKSSKSTPRNHHHRSEDVRSMFLASDINYSEVAIGEEDEEEEDEGEDGSTKSPLKASYKSSAEGNEKSGHGKAQNMQRTDDDDDDDDIDEEDLCCAANSSSSWGTFNFCCASTKDRKSHAHTKLADQDVEFGSSSTHGLTTISTEDGDSIKTPKSAINKRALVLRQRTVLLATGNYGILAMAYILFDETIPLFLKLSQSYGGLEFTSSQIGFLLSISGGAMLGFNYYFLPYFITRTSKKSMFEWGIIGSIPFALLWPVLALINKQILVPEIHNHMTYLSILWPTLIGVCILKNVFACLSFTAVMLQINHSVYEEYLGAVNGLGQSLASLARAFGPALGGLLWSVSIQQRFVFLNFLSVVAILIVSLVINRMLPDSINHKKKKKRGNNHGEEEEGNSGGGAMIMH